MKLKRPVLRYHGSKWRIAPWVISHFPPHEVYVEPFGGGAAVLLRKGRSKLEVYNDLDGEVVNVFKVLRDPEKAEVLIRLLELTPFARAEFELSYKTTKDPIEQARRTISGSFMGYGGTGVFGCPTGFRAVSGRKQNTAASIDWKRYPWCLGAVVERLRGVVIENRLALEVIEAQDCKGALHYVDPPYPKSVRNSNGRVYRCEMTDDDHRELAGKLHRVDGMVVVSGYACALYDEELYAGWTRVTRQTKAGGSCEKGAVDREEVLWINSHAMDARLPLLVIGRNG